MIRKFNYTGRKKIRRSNVQIDLLRSRNGHRQFNIALQLDDLALPANAHVYVEAYHRSGYQRFDFGTIAHRAIPSDRTLRKFANSALPLFRVKVVSTSRCGTSQSRDSPASCPSGTWSVGRYRMRSSTLRSGSSTPTGRWSYQPTTLLDATAGLVL